MFWWGIAVTHYEFFVGSILEKKDLFDKLKGKFPKYPDEKLTAILETINCCSYEDIWTVLVKKDRQLCAYAMGLANHVAQHKINLKNKG